VLEKFGLDPKTSPLKPMSVEQCVSEALDGLRKNCSKVIPGRLNRIMNALVPTSLGRKMQADMIGKGLPARPQARRPRPSNGRVKNRGAAEAMRFRRNRGR